MNFIEADAEAYTNCTVGHGGMETCLLRRVLFGYSLQLKTKCICNQIWCVDTYYIASRLAGLLYYHGTSIIILLTNLFHPYQKKKG